MLKNLLTILIVIVCAAPLMAQQSGIPGPANTTPTGLGVKPALTPWSLLSSDKITWSHSYSVSYFSGGNTSSSVGLLHTTMNYEISSKLSLSVNLGMRHNAGALFGSGEHDASVLPGFRLDYRPSDNVFMSVSVQTYEGYVYPYYGRNYYRRVSPYLID